MGKKTCASRAKYAKAANAAPSADDDASRRLEFQDENGAERDPLSDAHNVCDKDAALSKESEHARTSSTPEAAVPPDKPHGGGSQRSTKSCRSAKKFCVQCCKGGQMLVCSVTDCPVSIHSKCLRSSPKFDESGNYYCPYCSYKRALEHLEKMKRKALLAKQALSNFLGVKVGNGLKKAQKEGNINKEQTSSSPLRNQNQADDGNVVENDGDGHQCTNQKDDGDKSNNEVLTTPSEKYNEEADKVVHQSTYCAHERDQEILGSEEAVQEEVSEGVVDQRPNETPNASLKQMLVDSDVNQEPSIAPEFTNKTGGRRTKQKRQRRTEETSARSSTDGDVPKLKEKVNVEIEKSESNAEDSHEISSDSGWHGRAHSDNVDSSEKGSSQSDIPGCSPHALRSSAREQIRIKKISDVGVANVKQKQRLHWTNEEEEMLKEGVQKFSESINKNIPWRKILEFGAHVFDPARKPSDLKEKWKKIIAKGT